MLNKTTQFPRAGRTQLTAHSVTGHMLPQIIFHIVSVSSAATTHTIWGAERESCKLRLWSISVLSVLCPLASVTQTQAPLITHQQTPSCWVSCGREGVDQVFSFSRFFQHDSRHHRYAQLVYIRFPRTINCMRSWILWNLIFLISEISTRLWAFGPGEKRGKRGSECQG